LLKILFLEPETRRVIELLAAEDHVVVSALARLEALGQIHGRLAAGLLARPAVRTLVSRFDEILECPPYEVVQVSSRIIDQAEEQVRRFSRDAYCPTLDRLHLAAMEEIGLRRLLTNDDTQARAARALGFSVVSPR
jgi:uncharacterized protein with PIN domain